jgi:hypothetical protein
MPSRLPGLKPAEGKEIMISVLEIERREEMLWISSEPVPQDDFPPCIKNIIQKTGEKSGRHRATAIMAAFLGQVGWKEIEAKNLWPRASAAEERVFSEWFSMMHCPKCQALKRESKGYPELGIADLGHCLPDEKCREFEGPVEYAAKLENEEDKKIGFLKHIKTLYVARVFDWTEGRECEIELNEVEIEDLQNHLKGQNEENVVIYARSKVRGRLRPKFSLRRKEGLRRCMLSDIL